MGDGRLSFQFVWYYFKVSKFWVVIYVDIMPTKEEIQTKVDRLTELLRDSKKKLEDTIAA